MIKTTWLSRMRRSLGEYSPSSSRLRVVKDRSRGRHRESLKILLLSFHKIVEGKSPVLIVHLAKVLNFTFRVTEGALWQGADKISLHDFSTFLIFGFLVFLSLSTPAPGKEVLSELLSRRIPSSFPRLAKDCTWKPRALQRKK